MGRKSTTYYSKKNQKKFRKGKKSTNKNQVKKKSTKKKSTKKKQKGGTSVGEVVNGNNYFGKSKFEEINVNNYFEEVNLNEIYEEVSNINDNYWCKDIFNMGEYVVKKVIERETHLVSFNEEIELCILKKTELEELGERIRTINNFIEQLTNKKNNTSSGSSLKKKKLLEYCEKLKSEMEIYESIVKIEDRDTHRGEIENFNYEFNQWYYREMSSKERFNTQKEAKKLAIQLIEKLIELHKAMIETEKVKKEYEKAPETANNVLNITFENDQTW